MKTLLKLHSNGDFELMGLELIESGGSYSFSEHSITVPSIIEHPPTGTRNFFIEKTSISGWIEYDGSLQNADEGDRVSDLIDVDGWDIINLRIRYRSLNNFFGKPWIVMAFYNVSQRFIGMGHEDFGAVSVGDYVFEKKVPSNAKYMRVCTSYYDVPGVNVRISVEKGDISNHKHYPALEDLPGWVVDTGNPISFFSEGIVIKGELIIN